MSDYPTENLRLAAQALVEWRTPRESLAYREVLDQILKTHPFASKLGLRPGHPVFDCDDQGLLLWYLSGTMDTEAPHIGDDEKEWHKTISSRSEEIYWTAQGLLGASHVGASDGPAWNGGPLKSQVVDATLRALTNDDRNAMRALVALVAPLSEQLKARWVMAIEQRHMVNWNALVELSRRFRTLPIVLERLALLMFVTSAALTAVAIPYMFIEAMPELLDRIAFWLNATVQTTPWSWIWLRSGMSIFAISSVGAGIGAFFLGLSATLTQDRITSLVSRVLREQVAMRKTAERSGKLEGWLKACALESIRICMAEPDVFRTLLEEHGDSCWADLALASKDAISVPVLKQLLPLLRSPELSGRTRIKLLLKIVRAT
jgi:hypothetical protein